MPEKEVQTTERRQSGNETMNIAKLAGNDEFFTQYDDIQAEINAYDRKIFEDKTILLPCDDPEWSKFTQFFINNFDIFGIKKLISTSYAHAEKEKNGVPYNWEPSEFEIKNPQYDPALSATHGKVFTLVRNPEKKHTDKRNLEWHYLEGTGDFRSDEVCRLRDESDIIITNPPFSLFREFVRWIFDAEKKFIIIGNKNAITYKEVFPLIKENKMWIGATSMSKDLHFFIPECYVKSIQEANRSTAVAVEDGNIYGRSPAVWFTNLEHRRHFTPLPLMTMAEIKKYSSHSDLRGKDFQKYDNYDAIEVPYVDAIPDDYDGVMGVPISFLDKYCPEQFEIVWTTDRGGDGMLEDIKLPHTRYDAPVIEGNGVYKRIFIRRIKTDK